MGPDPALDVFRWAGPIEGDYLRVDWAASPLGLVQDWPSSLRTSLSICLSSASPTVIAWARSWRCCTTPRSAS